MVSGGMVFKKKKSLQFQECKVSVIDLDKETKQSSVRKEMSIENLHFPCLIYSLSYCCNVWVVSYKIGSLVNSLFFRFFFFFLLSVTSFIKHLMLKPMVFFNQKMYTDYSNLKKYLEA